MITVKQLIELLQEQDENDVVVLSQDEEGNWFNPISSISEAVYSDNEISTRELTPELEEKGYCEDDLCHNEECVKCIVLWP